jgi:hypothetical protein
MNIIKEQREDVIRENNTAQKDLVNILEDLNKRTDVLDIREHLQGDLDFAILKEMGFTNIKSISFEAGDITNIQNIPEGVTQLKCGQNLLFSLENLPSSLTHLEIPENYLVSINLSEIPSLTYLNLAHNHLVSLENLPSEIEEIHCEHNKLTHLDLKGLPNLKVLNISNNNITIIENLPENIVDFTMENTPSIEFRNSPVIPNMNRDKTEEDSIQQNINYNESLYEYFRLKNRYETKLYIARKTAFESAVSKKVGKKRAQLVKPKCIQCDRPVGTIFSRKDERYMAICGDTVEPCKLNIEIFSGGYDNIQNYLYLFYEQLQDEKDIIIRQKLDTLFNYVSEAESIQLFKKTLENFNFESQTVKNLMDSHNENYHNPDKNELIQKKKDLIFVFIERIRALLEEYEKTDNREVLKTAVQLQIDDLLPETRNLRLLQSEHMEMNEHKTKKGKVEYALFKNDVALSKDDFTFGEPSRVIKFHKSL